MAADTRPRDRIAAACAVATVHMLVAYLVLSTASHPIRHDREADLTLFVPHPAPPPPAMPAPTLSRQAGTAAPAARTADPVARAAPTPIIPVPASVPAAPLAAEGVDLRAGSSATDDAGTGAAGSGAGLGAGGSGTGTGGGGVAVRARRIAGGIGPRDYPPAARRRGAQGAATVAFTVDADGRARDCTVTAASGDADLDAATCALILARFRYAPARDADGRPVAERRGWRQDWWFD